MASGGQWTPRAAARGCSCRRRPTRPWSSATASWPSNFIRAKQGERGRRRRGLPAFVWCLRPALSADFGRAAQDAAAIARHRAAAAAARRQADWEAAMGGPADQQPSNPGPARARKAEAAARAAAAEAGEAGEAAPRAPVARSPIAHRTSLHSRKKLARPPWRRAGRGRPPAQGEEGPPREEERGAARGQGRCHEAGGGRGFYP